MSELGHAGGGVGLALEPGSATRWNDGAPEGRVGGGTRVDLIAKRFEARYLEVEGKTAEALALYRAIAEHHADQDPDDQLLPVYLKICWLSFKLGEREAAITGLLDVADRYARAGDTKSVIGIAVRLPKLDPTLRDLHLRFARTMLEAGQVRGARELLIDLAARRRTPKLRTTLDGMAAWADDQVREQLLEFLDRVQRRSVQQRPAQDARGGPGPRPSAQELPVPPDAIVDPPTPPAPPAETPGAPARARRETAPMRAVARPEQEAPQAPAQSEAAPAEPARPASRPDGGAERAARSTGPRQLDVPAEPTGMESVSHQEPGGGDTPQPSVSPSPPPTSKVTRDDDIVLLTSSRDSVRREAPARRRRTTPAKAVMVPAPRERRSTGRMLAVAAVVVVAVGVGAVLGRSVLAPAAPAATATPSPPVLQAPPSAPASAGADARPAAEPEASTVENAGSLREDTLATAAPPPATAATRPAPAPVAVAAPLSTTTAAAPARDSAPAGQSTPATTPPPQAPADPTPRATDTLAVQPAPVVEEAPASSRFAFPVVIVEGLEVLEAEQEPGGTRTRVTQLLSTGDTLVLSLTDLGPSSLGVGGGRILVSERGDGAMGSTRVGQFVVTARAPIAPSDLEALLGRLIEIRPN